MDLVNSDVGFDISQLSRTPRLQSLTFPGILDEDYINFLQNIFHHPCYEFQNDKDDHFLSLVGNSENEAFNGDHHFLNLVETSGDEVFIGDADFVNLVEKSENEVLDDDDDDPQYKLFLSHVKGNGKSFTFQMKDENGIYETIEYDKEEQTDGRRYLKKNRNKDNVKEEDICQRSDHPETNDFKVKLMALLRKPFDEQEYNTLWHEVTQRRYKLRHMELQDGGEKSVRTKIKTKSYLQKHKTFRRAIKAVPEDKFKKLNILRGFVFWLQHLPCGRTFKPWENASCLAVMPGTH